MELKNWQNKFEKFLLSNPTDDASHDLGHFRRVWKFANKFSAEDDDKLIILAACYFHDIVNYPKNDPRRSRSSIDAAQKAKLILLEMEFPKDKINHVAHCIESHSFSAGIGPETNEAKILQDADRIESRGAIGLARTFYVAGRMGSQLFDGEDPFAVNRDLNDAKYAIDHFRTKLLKLPATMKTDKGKEEAIRRAKILENFLDDLKLEL